MGGSCIYCGASFIDSVTAKYCVDCYNKHEVEIENYRALCDYCKNLCDLLDQDPDNEKITKKINACSCGDEKTGRWMQ